MTYKYNLRQSLVIKPEYNVNHFPEDYFILVHEGN